VSTANQLMAELKKSADNVRLITEHAAGPEGVPALLARADETMRAANETITSANVILDDLAILSERLPTIAKNVDGGTANFPAIARNVEEVTGNLPALLTQMQVTIRQLDQLIVQIRGSWLLGGGKSAQPQGPAQFSPSQVLP
jgi:phospholipid/cholesterol/gamma-HCH transport system substrate-binding protein